MMSLLHLQLVHVADERNHDLGLNVHAFFLELARGLEDGARLHLGYFRIGDAETAAPVAQHGVELMERFDLCLDFAHRHLHLPCHLLLVFFFMRNKFMEGRIKEADGDAESLHRLEDAVEIFPLHREELGQGLLSAGQIIGEDHLAHGLDPVAFKEHVLGAAEADALGAEIAGHLRVMRRVGVGPDAQFAGFIRPFHDGAEIAGKLRV